MESTYSVYIHTVPDGRKYVGITNRDPESRWLGGRGYKENNLFFSAIIEYGWANIEHEIIASGLTKEQASKIETELIQKYETEDIERGFNNTTGGVSGFTHSAETRKRIGEISREKWSDPEFRRKMIDIQKVAQSSPEVKRKKAEYSRKRYHEDSEYRNKFKRAQQEYVHSDKFRTEQSERSKAQWRDPIYRERMREAMSGDNNPSARPIAQYDVSGNLIAIYKTCKEGAEKAGISKGGISSCARGRQKTAGGYVWRYADVI